MIYLWLFISLFFYSLGQYIYKIYIYSTTHKCMYLYQLLRYSRVETISLRVFCMCHNNSKHPFHYLYLLTKCVPISQGASCYHMLFNACNAPPQLLSASFFFLMGRLRPHRFKLRAPNHLDRKRKVGIQIGPHKNRLFAPGPRSWLEGLKIKDWERRTSSRSLQKKRFCASKAEGRF